MTVTPLHREGHAPEPRTFYNCAGSQHAEILEATGITYRQLNYWTKAKYVSCHYHVGGKIIEGKPGGSGSTACWPPDQVKRIGRIKRLLDCGFDLLRCFQLATDIDDLEKVLLEIGGVYYSEREEGLAP
jgi:hypothetical protein